VWPLGWCGCEGGGGGGGGMRVTFACASVCVRAVEIELHQILECILVRIKCGRTLSRI